MSEWMGNGLEKIVEKIGEVCERFEKELGKGWEVEHLDKLEEFFNEMAKVIEEHGGKVKKKYIAPNGYITFEFGGRTYCFDLIYGFFEGEDVVEAIAKRLSKILG